MKLPQLIVKSIDSREFSGTLLVDHSTEEEIDATITVNGIVFTLQHYLNPETSEQVRSMALGEGVISYSFAFDLTPFYVPGKEVAVHAAGEKLWECEMGADLSRDQNSPNGYSFSIDVYTGRFLEGWVHTTSDDELSVEVALPDLDLRVPIDLNISRPDVAQELDVERAFGFRVRFSDLVEESFIESCELYVDGHRVWSTADAHETYLTTLRSVEGSLVKPTSQDNELVSFDRSIVVWLEDSRYASAFFAAQTVFKNIFHSSYLSGFSLKVVGAGNRSFIDEYRSEARNTVGLILCGQDTSDIENINGPYYKSVLTFDTNDRSSVLSRHIVDNWTRVNEEQFFFALLRELHFVTSLADLAGSSHYVLVYHDKQKLKELELQRFWSVVKGVSGHFDVVCFLSTGSYYENAVAVFLRINCLQRLWACDSLNAKEMLDAAYTKGLRVKECEYTPLV